MIFTDTDLKGAMIIDIERYEDERGFFARSWDRNTFLEKGLNANLIQCNISFNAKKGTLRGMHYQIDPHEEAKLVRCTKGNIFDVIVDLRPKSETFMRWTSTELSDKNHRMLYIPEGFAHGFQTLEDNTEVFYQMSEIYAPECARGILWNDIAFKIKWPFESPIISKKDSSFEPFKKDDYTNTGKKV